MEQQQTETPVVVIKTSHEREEDALTYRERMALEQQRELSRLAPGSAPFRALKKSLRAGRVFKHHMLIWASGPFSGESRRSRG